MTLETAKYLAHVPLGAVAGYVLARHADQNAIVETLRGFLMLTGFVTLTAVVFAVIHRDPRQRLFWQRAVLFWLAAALGAWISGTAASRSAWTLSLLAIAVGSAVGVALVRLIKRPKERAV